MTDEQIARGLDLKRIGRTWRGACPVHGGSSFTLTERDGVPLWTCWSGCDRGQILEELRRRGLWPERERREWTPAERCAYAQRRGRARDMARLAGLWHTERLADLEDAKRAALSPFDPWALQAAASEHYRLSTLDEPGVLQAWLAARADEPMSTRMLERQGERWADACKDVVRLVLDRPAEVPHVA